MEKLPLHCHPYSVYTEILRISGRGNCKADIFALGNEISRRKNHAPTEHVAGRDWSREGCKPSRALRVFLTVWLYRPTLYHSFLLFKMQSWFPCPSNYFVFYSITSASESISNERTVVPILCINSISNLLNICIIPLRQIISCRALMSFLQQHPGFSWFFTEIVLNELKMFFTETYGILKSNVKRRNFSDMANSKKRQPVLH